jgi:hypothetical protein
MRFPCFGSATDTSFMFLVMRYYNSKDSKTFSFEEVVLTGIADDGGNIAALSPG